MIVRCKYCGTFIQRLECWSNVPGAKVLVNLHDIRCYNRRCRGRKKHGPYECGTGEEIKTDKN